MPEKIEGESSIIKEEKEAGMETPVCPICEEAILPSDPRRTSKEWVKIGGVEKEMDLHVNCMYEEPDKFDELRGRHAA